VKKARTPSILRNESGVFTFLVAGAAAGLLALAIAILSLNKGSKMGGVDAVRFYAAVDVIKANVYFFGQNAQAWSRTLSYNQSLSRMTSVNTGANCTVAANFNLDEKVDLVLPSNTLYYQTTSLNLGVTANLTALTGHGGTLDGFRYDGQVCNYQQDKIVSGCAIQLDLRWRPFCNADCPCGESFNLNRIVFHGFWRTPNQTDNNKALHGYKFNSNLVNGVIAQ
jgi:hypothetical protein